MAKAWVGKGGGGLSSMRLIDRPVPPPAASEISIRVVAAGVNPADYKRLDGSYSGPVGTGDIELGFEVSGIITAMGSDARVAWGEGAVGSSVIAFRVSGGYASEITVPARDVLAKPSALTFPAAANLLLAGTTAAELLDAARVSKGDTVLVHGASGAVGVSLLQQARSIGARVIGTASPGNALTVLQYGGIPTTYGVGLENRVRSLAPQGVDVALDCVGTDEAIEVSLSLLGKPGRIVTIAAREKAEALGILAIGAHRADSLAFRDRARAGVLALASAAQVEVPMAALFPLSGAKSALELVRSGHPGGKVALIP